MKIQPFNMVHIGVLVIQTKACFLKCSGYLFLWRLQGKRGIPSNENMLMIEKYTIEKHTKTLAALAWANIYQQTMQRNS